MNKPKDQDPEAERKRDEVLRTMLSTPPKPNWRPTNVRKKRVTKNPSVTRSAKTER